MDAPRTPSGSDPPPPGFDIVFRSYRRYVWRTLERLSIPERDLEDLVQDVFLVVHRKLHTYEGRSEIKAWIAGIAYRIALDYRERRGNVCEELQAQAVEPVDLAHPTPETSVMLGERRELILELLETISLEKRIVLIMHDIERLTIPVIALELELHEEATKARLRRARSDFRAATQKRSESDRGLLTLRGGVFGLVLDPMALLDAERQIPLLQESISSDPPNFDAPSLLQSAPPPQFSWRQVAFAVGVTFGFGAVVGALVHAALRPSPPPLVPVAEPTTTLAVYRYSPAPTYTTAFTTPTVGASARPAPALIVSRPGSAPARANASPSSTPATRADADPASNSSGDGRRKTREKEDDRTALGQEAREADISITQKTRVDEEKVQPR